MKRICRPRSYLMLCRWPALVHPLLALAVLGSGCAAGGPDTADEAATPAGRGTPNVVSSASSTQPTNTATTTPSNTPSNTPSSAPSSTASTPATSSANEAPAVSTLTPTGNGAAQIGDDDDDDDDARDDDARDDDDRDDDDDDRDDDDDQEDDDRDDDDDDVDVDVTPPTPGAGVPAPSATPVTFTNDIRSLLVENCGRCHASGGLPAFASANASTAFNVAVSERNAIVREITAGDMPADTCNGGAPGTAGCVSTADLALIRAWIAAGTPQ